MEGFLKWEEVNDRYTVSACKRYSVCRIGQSTWEAFTVDPRVRRSEMIATGFAFKHLAMDACQAFEDTRRASEAAKAAECE